MIELRIDNKLAEIPANLEFSFVVENPYFTDASEYTEEIELYPKSPRNAKIFGSVFRHEKSKKKSIKDCELRVNNRIWLKGKSTTTEYTDRSIKLQLLGGNSVVNYLIAFDKVYIDEMELGRYDVNRWSDILNPLNYLKPSGETDWEGFAKRIMASPEENEWVMLPAKNLEGDSINSWNRFWAGPEQSHHRPDGTDVELGFGYPQATAVSDLIYDEKYALQPRLTAIVRRVIKGLGYNVIEFDAENTPLKFIYYVNVKDTFYLNEMLPHWTANEFINEIQNYFGCVFVFDTINNTCRIKNRGAYIKSDKICLHEIDDRFNVNFNEDSKDIKISNLKYAQCEVDKIHLFDDYANENAKIVNFSDLQDNDERYEDVSKNTVIENKDRYFVIHETEDEAENTENIIVKPGVILEEVNHLGNRYDKNVNDNIEIKIVPATFETERAYDIFWNKSGMYLNGDRICAVGESPTDNKDFNIDRYIHDGIEKKENSLDLMRVAVFRSWDEIDEYMGSFPVDGTWTFLERGRTKFYRPWTYHVNDIDNIIFIDTLKYSPTLALRNIQGYDTVYSLGIDKAKIVNTKEPHEITFYDEVDPNDIDKTFIIRNHLYLCEKIDFKVSNKGIKKAKTGTFYRID